MGEPEESETKIFADQRSGTLFVVGSEAQQASVKSIINELEEMMTGGESSVEVVRTEFADARDVANAVDRFLRNRSRATGQKATVVVTEIPNSGAMLVAGTADEVKMVKDRCP